MSNSADKQNTPARILIIAGSDSGGGAGIQADIKTVTMLGGYAATAITAITAQNTQGVAGVIPIAPEAVVKQAGMILSDIGADIIKTGMLGDKKLIEVLGQFLSDHCKDLPRVIDPVMVATSGDPLLPRDAISSIKAVMLPNAIVTPNAPEAALLMGKDVEDINGQRRAGEAMLEAGAKAAIIKGGHIQGDRIVDLIATPNGEIFLEQERLFSTSTHGTGCTMASAIATGIAQGLGLERAVKRAQIYVAEAIRHAPGLGKGHGPLAHNWLLEFPEKAENLFRPFRV